MSIEVRPLSEALGAEVRGLDLEQPIAAADVEALRAAFLDSHFLCLRSDPIDAASFARLARHFGEPQLQLLREFRHGSVPDRKSTRLNSSHVVISYAVFCLKKKKIVSDSQLSDPHVQLVIHHARPQ